MLPDKIWSHSRNGALREHRKDRHLLCSGDEVYVPDRDPGKEQGETSRWHHYGLLIPLVDLHVRLVIHRESLEDTSYQLVVGDRTFSGTTSNGELKHRVPADAAVAEIRLEGWAPIRLELGKLDPVDTERGREQRLSNLGFYNAPADEDGDTKTKAAARAWRQCENGSKTLESIETDYGC